MKYFVFSAVFAVVVGGLSVLFGPDGFDDPTLVGDAFAQGFGWGLGSLLIGCLGLLYKRDRLRGFMVASFLFALLGLIGSMRY